MNKTCFIIAGPTAVGKTAMAIRLANHFGTEIISADSRQCYREMSIGVAKPSPEELAAAHHYFINSHSIQEDVNAVVFEQYALQAVNTIFARNDVAVMVGGTGLYIKAFCQGLDDIPPVAPDLRDQLNEAYEQNGLVWLQQQVASLDPVFYSNGEIQNPHRLLRALAVKMTTGKSIREYQQGNQTQRPFRIVKIGLELLREELYGNINQRVDVMMKEGQLKEAEGLYEQRHLSALQTVGYAELFKYMQGQCTRPEAVEEIKKNTRHYAKRQMTWFKKDADIQWFSPQHAEAVIDHCQLAL